MLAHPIFLLAGGIASQRYINIGSGRLRNWPLDWTLRFTIDVEVKCSLLKSLGCVTCTHARTLDSNPQKPRQQGDLQATHVLRVLSRPCRSIQAGHKDARRSLRPGSRTSQHPPAHRGQHLARTGCELGISCCGWFYICPVGPGATWDLVAVARFMFVPSGPGANWELVAAVGSVFVPLGRVRPGIYLLWSVLCLRRLGRVKLGISWCGLVLCLFRWAGCDLGFRCCSWSWPLWPRCESYTLQPSD